jgi:EF-hand domain pair
LSCLTSFLQSSTANIGASSASDPLSALTQSVTGGDADGDGDQSAASPAAGGSGASSPAFNPCMLAALLAIQSQQQAGVSAGGTGASGLLSKLDTNGDGQIDKAEFESALGSAGVDTSSADALFSKLDSNGDGTVSQSELAAVRHGHHHHHMAGAGQGGGSGGGGLSALLNGTSVDSSTTQTATNADGSTTTTISYADGSTVDMTIPASSQAAGSSGASAGTPSQSNLIEQLIKLQSQLVAQTTSALSTVV